ncbi:hypothetical protein SLA2020_176130 [Shorea laevis]
MPQSNKMKKQALAWLFLIICFNLLISSFSATNQKPMITEEKQFKGVDKIKRSYKGMHEVVQYRNVKELKEFNVSIHNNSGHKGQGVNGGGDVVRPRPKKGAANSLLPKSCSLSSLLRHASTLGLLIFLFFF